MASATHSKTTKSTHTHTTADPPPATSDAPQESTTAESSASAGASGAVTLTTTPTKQDVQAAATALLAGKVTFAQAFVLLFATEAALDLQLVAPSNELNQRRLVGRVSTAAMTLAGTIAASDPKRLADFQGIGPALARDAQLQPLVTQASTFTAHVTLARENNLGPAAEDTLTLYQLVKGYGRVKQNVVMRENIPLLKEEIVPKRSKAKETKAEKTIKRSQEAESKKIAKAIALLQAAGIQVPGAAAGQTGTSTTSSNTSTATGTNGTSTSK